MMLEPCHDVIAATQGTQITAAQSVSYIERHTSTATLYIKMPHRTLVDPAVYCNPTHVGMQCYVDQPAKNRNLLCGGGLIEC